MEGAVQERRVGAWALETQIGSGSFAVVWKARHTGTGEAVAVKEINLDKLNAKLRQSLECEVSILKRIAHPNIVHLHEVHEERGKLFLVMEYCAGGDLAHYLRATRRVPEPVARHFLRQLAAGLQEMWAHHLVHRDLKPQNLLLSARSPDAVLKIADFGFARALQPQGLAETLCGSPLYMAPEILRFHKYDAKADLWSVGAILYELLVGRPPFTGANQFQLLRNIERSEARLPEPLASALSLTCRQLIHCLLRRNPVERISFEEFFSHAFVTPAPGTNTATRADQAGGLRDHQQRVAPEGAGAPAAGQRQLLFSTSAPAAALPGGGLARSPSAGSIPQQVLGFAQQAGKAGGAAAGQGAAAARGLAAPQAPAAVPVGQLSCQLKPRLSLDLDGTKPPGRRLASMQQQQQQQQQQRQQQQQQLQQHRWRVSLHRQPSHGSPLTVGTPGQPPRQQEGGSTAPSRLAVAAVAQSCADGAPRVQAGMQRVHGFQPAAPESPQQLPPAQTPHTGGAGADSAAGGAQRGSQSAHSIDDDYVLVDTCFSGGTATAAATLRGSSPSLAGSGNSANGRLQARAQLPAASGLAVNSAASRDAHADEVFAMCHDLHPGSLVAPGGLPGATATAGAAAADAGDATSWMGTSRWRLLQRAAGVLERLAAGHSRQSRHAQAVALLVAALQLLEGALEAAAADGTCLQPGDQPGDQPCDAAARSTEDGQAPKTSGAPLPALQKDAVRIVGAAQAAAAALQAAAAAEAAAGGTDASAPLPDPWELAYVAALGWAREAAVDELLGNQAQSLELYSQAGTLMALLATEASSGASVALQPPLQLAPPDRLRLQKYAAAMSARWAACAEAAAAATVDG